MAASLSGRIVQPHGQTSRPSLQVDYRCKAATLVLAESSSVGPPWQRRRWRLSEIPDRSHPVVQNHEISRRCVVMKGFGLLRACDRFATFVAFSLQATQTCQTMAKLPKKSLLVSQTTTSRTVW